MSQADYDRIARAIRFIDRNYADQPSLEAVAGAAGLSPFHLQRLFRRWAGISPKRFLQVVTVAHAKAALARSSSVLDAAFASGLSGPSRLHDLMVACDGVTPGEFRARGAGLTIRTGFHDGPFGPYLIGLTTRGICYLGFVDEGEAGALADLAGRYPAAELVADPVATGRMARALFAGGSLSLHLIGTNHQVKVWQALLAIPPGAVTTYGGLAERLGEGRASARAIAGAVAANPVAYLVPCHRVIRGSGALGGYYYGLTRKRAMLAWEAAYHPIATPEPAAAAV